METLKMQETLVGAEISEYYNSKMDKLEQQKLV